MEQKYDGECLDESISSNIRSYKAVYLEQDIQDYTGNPFLEALPPILNDKAIVTGFQSSPYYNEEERNHSKQYRCHYLRRLNTFFQPYAVHFKLHEMFDCALRQSYLSRNPIDRREKVQLNEIYNNMLGGNFEFCFDEEVASDGFLIIGISGGGKSRSLSRLLRMYPQVIRHETYKGELFFRNQVVYLKIDCPHDGTLKGLAGIFFKELDKVVGSQYAKKYENLKKYSMPQLMLAIENLIVVYGIGVLIVDEIQHLSVAKSQGEEMMLNFFVTLSNYCKIPIIFVGTPKTETLFTSALRQTRRMCGQGDLTWNRLEKNSKEWELFVESIWRYQWTNQYTPLTDDLKNAFYDECQGIVAVAVKLFILVQIESMKKKKEIITVSMFEKAVKMHLRVLLPILKALKSGSQAQIRKFDDILTKVIHTDSNKVIDEVINTVTEELLRQKREKEKGQQQNNFEDLKFMLMTKLQELNINYKVAEQAVETVLREHDNQYDNINFLLQEALLYGINLNKQGLVVNGESSTVQISEEKATELLVKYSENQLLNQGLQSNDTKDGKQSDLELEDSDLRRIAEQGEDSKKNDAYDALKQANLIKDI